MKYQKTLLGKALLPLLLILSSTTAVAASPAFDCAGVQTLDVLETTVITCTGSLSISGGELSSNRSISISSAASVTLNDLVLTAPFIYIVGDPISLSSSVTVNTQHLYLDSPDTITATTPSIINAINLGESAYINTNIPEPNSGILLTFGVLMLGLFCHYKSGRVA